jgi:predicted O-methyltransferase YrrM
MMIAKGRFYYPRKKNSGVSDAMSISYGEIMTNEELDAIEAEVNSVMGPEDRTWFRGKEGTLYFHNAPGDFCASVEYEIGYKLRDLVLANKPEVLVEVGTSKGFSGFWLMLAMLRNGKGHLITFDPADVIKDCGAPFWKKFGLPSELVTYSRSLVWDAPPELPQSIDFVFEDASHEVDDTQKIVETLAPRVKRGGIMAFHDIFLCRHEGSFLLKWFGEHADQWDYKEIQEGRGLGIARKR